MRGKRKSRAEHVATGNPSRRQLPPDTPASAAEPDPPAGLDEVGRARWVLLAADLRERSILSVSFCDIMRLYCETYSAYIRAVEESQTEELLIRTDSGELRINPIQTLVGRLSQRMERCISQLGCSPTTIAKVRGMKTDSKPTGKATLLRLRG